MFLLQSTLVLICTIRALGSPSGNKEIHVNYPRIAIDVFLNSLVPALPKGQPFRFVFTSGGLVPVLDYGPAAVRLRVSSIINPLLLNPPS